MGPWSVLLVLGLLLGLAPPLAAPAHGGTGSPATQRSNAAATGWTQYLASGENTLRAHVDGTATPGVRWLRDFTEPTAAERLLAPEGYDLLHASLDGLAPISADGVLVMFATDRERRARIGGANARRELIGVDAVSGDVRWEIPGVGYDGQGPLQGVTGPRTSSAYCTPAVDSQGRLWVAHTPSQPDGTGYRIVDPHVMAYDLQTGSEIAGTRFPLPRQACKSAGSLHIGGSGSNERLLIYAYPTGDRDTFDDFVAAGADGSVLAIDISGPTPREAWTLRDSMAGQPQPSFDLLLGSGPIPWGLWQGSPGYVRAVGASDDTSLFLSVGVAAPGGGYDVELRQLALSDGRELGRAAMPYPAMSPVNTRNRDSEEFVPTDPRTYFSYQLVTDGSTLVVGSHTGQRLRRERETVGGLGFLAAFDLAGGLSDPPRWRIEGDPFNDGSLDGRSRGNFGTLVLGDGVVVTQPRAESNPNTGALTYDGVGGFIARSLSTGDIAWQTDNVRYLSRHGRTPMDASGALYTVVPDTWGRSYAIKLGPTGSPQWAVSEWGLADVGAQPVPVEGTDGFLYRASPTIVGDDGTVYLEGPNGSSTLLALDTTNDVAVFAPEPPTGVTAERLEAAGTSLYRAEVSWDPPSDPRRAVESYTVTAEPGGRTCTASRATGQDMQLGTPTSCSLDFLTNNTRTTFTVTATNPVGVSVPSAPSNVVVFGDPPDEPDPAPAPDPAPDPAPAPTPGTGSFSDVPAGNVHSTGIEAVAAAGITTGCGGDRFCPGDDVTRAQMATFLDRALELPAAPSAGFTDVVVGNVHAAGINAVAQAQITTGCGPSLYCPGDAVTRAQMATFLDRALDLPPAPAANFSDVASANVHSAGIDAVAQAGITTGCGGDRFCPNDPVSRAQMATFLYRALLE